MVRGQRSPIPKRESGYVMTPHDHKHTHHGQPDDLRNGSAPLGDSHAKPLKSSVSALKVPVCGMSVTEQSPYHLEHDGQPFYFCSTGCQAKFRDRKSPRLNSSN